MPEMSEKQLDKRIYRYEISYAKRKINQITHGIRPI